MATGIIEVGDGNVRRYYNSYDGYITDLEKRFNRAEESAPKEKKQKSKPKYIDVHKHRDLKKKLKR